jgi:raffinose/stachyose/melibiose transport system permease protein
MIVATRPDESTLRRSHVVRAVRIPVTHGSWWWALPAIAVVVLVHYLAVAAGGFFAFTNWTGIGGFQWVGVANFIDIFRRPASQTALLNTLFLAVGFVIGSNTLGMLFALALNRTLKSRHLLRALLFAPVVLSPIAVSYIWQFIFQQTGPLNGLLAALGLADLQRTWLADPVFAPWTILVVTVWQHIGLCMVIYLAGLEGVPGELEDASQLDGAGTWARFRYVTLPLLRPSLVIASLLTLVQGLRIFDQVMALTGGGPAGATETLATLMYRETFAYGRFGYGAALSILLTILIVAFAVIQLAATRRRDL